MATIETSPATWEAVEAPVRFLFAASPPSYNILTVYQTSGGTITYVRVSGNATADLTNGVQIRISAPPQYNDVETTVISSFFISGPNFTDVQINNLLFNGSQTGLLYYDLDSVSPPEFDIIADSENITPRSVVIVPFGDGTAPAEVQAWLKTAVNNRLAVTFDGNQIDNDCFSEYKLNYRDLGASPGTDTGSFYVLNAARQAGSSPLAVSLLTEFETISRWPGYPVGVHALVMADAVFVSLDGDNFTVTVNWAIDDEFFVATADADLFTVGVQYSVLGRVIEVTAKVSSIPGQIDIVYSLISGSALPDVGIQSVTFGMPGAGSLSANAVHFIDLQSAVEGAELYLSI